jgi:hypothetical protein
MQDSKRCRSAALKHPPTIFVHDLASRLRCRKCADQMAHVNLAAACPAAAAVPDRKSRLRPQQESPTVVSDYEWMPTVQTAAAYLETLNPEQRRAVEHGAPEGLAPPPLLVIAGAGSGKTNTLAHRVAHLIVQGADPRRILLVTFSRRAASEMTKRVERIARKVMGDNAGVMTD